MKILFMGSPDFALESLKKLVGSHHEIVGVITQPDKPKGRGYTLTPTAVKAFAITEGIPAETPQTLKDGAILPLLERWQPDCIVVIAYGKILPEYVLSYPKYGCVNVHASLLPKYQGAAPINFVLINGEKETGVTTMKMDAGIDTGAMLLKKSTPILPSDDAGALHDRLAGLGADLLLETLDGLEKGEIVPEKQSGESCYVSKIDDAVKKLDFSQTAESIVNRIRGLSPFPTAFCFCGGKKMKVYKAEALDSREENNSAVPCGGLLSDKDLIVKAGTGAVRILSLAPEGKKRMSGQDFLRGIRDKQSLLFE